MKIEMSLTSALQTTSEVGDIFFSVVPRRKLKLKDFGFLSKYLQCVYD